MSDIVLGVVFIFSSFYFSFFLSMKYCDLDKKNSPKNHGMGTLWCVNR